MFEKLTDRARTVLSLAQKEAELRGISTPNELDVLLGMLSHGKGIPPPILSQYGITYDKALGYAQNLKVCADPQSRETRRERRLTAAEVARLGVEEAIKLENFYAGPEHLLLALLRDKGGDTAVFLESTGVPPESVLEEVLNLLGFDAYGRPLSGQ